MELPPPSINPNASPKPGALHVQRTHRRAPTVYDTPKTKGSRRPVPLTSATTELLREFVTSHPRTDDPTAPLFPRVQLSPVAPPAANSPRSSRRDPEHWRVVANRQAETLAALSVDEAAARLVVDWLRPSITACSTNRCLGLRRCVPIGWRGKTVLPPGFKFHGCRHTYASLCVAAGIPPLDVSRFMGHSRVTTTLAVYAHLFDSDHADSMAALELMSAPVDRANVVRLSRRN